MTRRLIIDCDPGIDDAVAIALCGASDELELLGITCTHGNVAVDQTTENALAIAALLNLDVPVYRGAERPLVRDLLPVYRDAGTGLGGVELPPHDRIAERGRAVDFIIDSVLADPGNVSLFGTGPLTNIAIALRLEPRLATAIKEIVIMGGAIGVGNKSPAAESNALADPHAMRIVLESGCPVTMFGLDVTHQVLALPERLARIDAAGTPVARIMTQLMSFYRPIYKQRFGWEGGAVHDLCTIAWALRPDLFTLQPMTVRVDTNEGPNFGRTICDVQCRNADVLPTVNVGVEARADGIFALLTERLTRY